MDCPPPNSSFWFELFCRRMRAAFRALLALCASFILSADALCCAATAAFASGNSAFTGRALRSDAFKGLMIIFR